ncbi:pro-epidermal growth factor-like [Ahaetulla prasina]|uniref:pro-epidermal growth factor-like n=1 Tax=Ahaetulla prasina TaxID=499056 RepID=UPI002648E688|nr:pro-epidermal growth factor-like [Ahaetulla prasina]
MERVVRKTTTLQFGREKQMHGFVQWIKEPRPLTLLDDQAVVIADEVEKMEISGLTESSFGYIRALVYDFHPEIPGRVLVAERLFLIKKDVSKTCEGSRGERSCRCNPGFEGRGVHCVDIDECTRGSHNCNRDALCLNTLGSYVCACQSGFVGDGSRCTAKSTWSPWSPWSPCSVTCGIQNQMRIRECTHEESGMRCLGPSADLKGCPNLQPCPNGSRPKIHRFLAKNRWQYR